MEIFWYGKNSIKVKAKDVEVFIDYLSDKVESSKKTIAELWLYSENHNLGLQKEEGSLISDIPGEFELFGAEAQILPINNHRVIKLKSEGVAFAHISKPSFELSQKQQEQMNGVDILFVSLSDLENNLKNIFNLLSKIEPKIVIPIGYESIDQVAQFFKNQSVDASQSINSLKIASIDLDTEEQKTLILNPQSI